MTSTARRHLEYLTTISVIAGLFLVAHCATSCSTLTPAQKATGQQVFTTVERMALAAGSAYIGGNSGQAAAAALFELANQPQTVTPATIQQTVTAVASPKIATIASSQFAVANPTTPDAKTYFLNTIGAALQGAANQQP